MRYNMARIYLNQEKWDKALEMMQPVYDANPEDFGNCMSMGWAICGLADGKDEKGNKTSKYEYKAATPYFKKATELDPENHQAWFWLERPMSAPATAPTARSLLTRQRP